MIIVLGIGGSGYIFQKFNYGTSVSCFKSQFFDVFWEHHGKSFFLEFFSREEQTKARHWKKHLGFDAPPLFFYYCNFLMHNHANSWWRLSSYENLKMYTHNISWNRWVKTCQKARRKVSGKFSHLFHENSDTVTAILVYSLTNIGILRPKYVYVSIRIVCTFRFAAAVGTNFGLIFHSGKMICTISLVHLEY